MTDKTRHRSLWCLNASGYVAGWFSGAELYRHHWLIGAASGFVCVTAFWVYEMERKR